ncbi:UDP-N-acetylmuramate dehydrogenase [Candidatus Gottesmanbacteria bacterium]|nr:UDP-N-acetylmuramate dehydrogenase [Candidatus Gottesmanbacteria bacterium]
MKDPLQKLKKILGDRSRENEPLARYTTFKIGGPADLFYEAKTTDELVSAVTEARKLFVPVFMLGGGTNILIGDRGIRGFVVKNATDRIAIVGAKGKLSGGTQVGTVFVEADSGVIMNKLVRFTIEEGLGGLETQLGLPGSVGGAVFMNSKWTRPQSYVGDSLYQATILTKANEVSVVPKSYFQFGYDQSSIQKTGDIVLRVVFSLKPGNKEKLWEMANSVIAYRRETQPQGVFSPGCTFRNISKSDAIAASTPQFITSAGFLLDHAGLKEVSVGDAQISPVHANFIINKGKATAADVVKLIERARNQVKSQFGVELVEEIVRVGEF